MNFVDAIKKLVENNENCARRNVYEDRFTRKPILWARPMGSKGFGITIGEHNEIEMVPSYRGAFPATFNVKDVVAEWEVVDSALICQENMRMMDDAFGK